MSTIREDLPSSAIQQAVQKVRYRIVITEYTNEFKVVEKSWEQGAGDPTAEGKASWGYTPAIENIVETERTILEQQVTELDLTAVIMAVNDIPKQVVIYDPTKLDGVGKGQE